MALPLKYSLRSLKNRKTATAMTVLGIAAATATILAVQGLLLGVQQVNVGTGSEQDILVLRKGALSEAGSSVSLDEARQLRSISQLAERDGNSMVSAELITALNLPRLEGGGKANVSLRGITERERDWRQSFEIVEGRPFRAGLHEVTVGRAISRRFEGLDLGQEIPVGQTRLKVVGLFEAGDSAYDSEIWGDFDVLRGAFHRQGYSSVTLRAATADAVPAILESVEQQSAGTLKARTYPEHFARQSEAVEQLVGSSFLLAVILGIGAAFAAANTMYAAVSQRVSEIAVLRSLGFRRKSILFAFLLESAFLGLLGGGLGALLTFGLSLIGWETGTMNPYLFAEQAFSLVFTPASLVTGLVFGLAIGGFGGLFPAIGAARKPVLEALRAT